MTTSEETKQQMKKWEGLKLFAYLDTGGVPTIGYGHTKGVSIGDAIIPQQANKLFDDDIAIFEKEVNRVKRKLTQNQFDALVSFCFNVGISAFRRSTLRRYVEMGMSADYIVKEFGRWIHDNGKPIKGLIERRKWEAQKYLGRSPLPA